MASKRKLDPLSTEPGSSKKLCKSQDPRNAHYDESKPDFSQLPTEVLQMIFKHLENPRPKGDSEERENWDQKNKRSNSDIGNLTRVCRRFSDILHQKLKLVCRNQTSGRAKPVCVHRSYDTIKITSSDLEFLDFEKSFGSSKETIQKLKISKCRMYDMTLVKLLRVLSNIKTLVIKDCEVWFPKNDVDMESMVGPDLKKLESMRIQKMSGPIMRCFGKAKHLQELTLIEFPDKLRSNVQDYIKAHSKILSSLKVDNKLLLQNMRFPNLQYFEVNNVKDGYRRFLQMAPKLEHLAFTNINTYHLDGLLFTPSKTLKTLKTSYFLNIDINEFRKAFPALQKLELGNSFKWP